VRIVAPPELHKMAFCLLMGVVEHGNAPRRWWTA